MERLVARSGFKLRHYRLAGWPHRRVETLAGAWDPMATGLCGSRALMTIFSRKTETRRLPSRPSLASSPSPVRSSLLTINDSGKLPPKGHGSPPLSPSRPDHFQSFWKVAT
jgi:hypothetical protein